MNENLLTFWISIEFSDYGATIISELSLCSLHGRSIWNVLLRLATPHYGEFIGVFWYFIFYNHDKN